jgi:hypothetical protein
VCNESRELFSLLNFLSKTIDDEDEVNVVVDSIHVTDKVERVLDHFKDRINVFRRPFDTFMTNAQFHNEKASGAYIFGLDADEIPREYLIKNVKAIIEESGADIIAIPRINIHPGSTERFMNASNFSENELGWINWPDYQMRIYKNCKKIQWTDELHTKLTGSDKVAALKPDPKNALWHIKSVEKQESRWTDGAFNTVQTNLYDLLM